MKPHPVTCLKTQMVGEVVDSVGAWCGCGVGGASLAEGMEPVSGMIILLPDLQRDEE